MLKLYTSNLTWAVNFHDDQIIGTNQQSLEPIVLLYFISMKQKQLLNTPTWMVKHACYK